MDRPGALVVFWNKINDLYARVFRKKSVMDEDFLYRHIHPDWRKPDGSISGVAFEHYELSVDLASLSTPQRSWRRARNPEFGLARLSVRGIRALPLRQEVRHWPEIRNWSHTLVIGEKKKQGKMKYKIAESAELIIDTGPFRADSGPSGTSHPEP